jgi:hypothetical protein
MALVHESETCRRILRFGGLVQAPIAKDSGRGVVARINFKPAYRMQCRFQSLIATDLGRPHSNIRLRMLQPRITSVFWESGSLDRSLSPIIDLYLKKAFSALPCL